MSPEAAQSTNPPVSDTSPLSKPRQLPTPPLSSSPSSPADLRNVTSISYMAPPMKDRTTSSGTDKSWRNTQPLAPVGLATHRLGSRSPVSIPSSPTSIHSSSSAIFERDIEPTHHMIHNSSNPHRMPRSKMTETLEQSVPSVLDSAASLLATTDEMEELFVDVEAPITTSRGTSVIGSPIGRGSRSPSPTMSAGGRNRTSMLLNLPSPIPSTIIPMSVGAGQSGSPPLSSSPIRPPLLTNLSSASSVDPSMPGAFGSFSPPQAQPPQRSGSPVSPQLDSAASSPTTTTMERPPHPLPLSTSIFPSVSTAPSSPPASAHILLPASQSQFSHPPSPSHAAHKRLSFISYNDLLASTPTSTQPLSSLTSPCTTEPPPHLPSVSLSLPVGSRSTSVAASVAGSARNSVIIDNVLGAFGPAADVKEPSGGGASDDIGGEWEREGLGRGLEERLETPMQVGPGRA